MAEESTTWLLNKPLLGCTGNLKTPEGCKTSIAAGWLEYRASKSNDTSIAGIDGCCKQQKREKDGSDHYCVDF